MRKLLLRVFESIEKAPLTLPTAFGAFGGLILTRLLLENALALFPGQTLFFFFFELSHTFLFFAFAFLLLLPLVRFCARVSLPTAANFLLFGFLIILAPPVIDTLIFRGGAFWSFYEFDGILGLLLRYVTLFGDTPHIGITYGVRVEVVIVTIALGAYTYLKTKKMLRALGAALGAYSVLFILGTFPSWITLAVLGFPKGLLAVNGNDVAALFLTPEPIFSRTLADFRSVLNVKMSLMYALLSASLAALLLGRSFPVYFWALCRNARGPQLFYHAGLLSLGMLLAVHFADAQIPFDFFHGAAFLVLLLAVLCAWLASVAVNDWYDRPIDVLTNPRRPLIEKTIPDSLYLTFGAIFFFASLLFAGLVSFSALLLLLAYQALAWLYSAPPLRLKRIPVLATLLAASAGLVVLITGFLAVSPTPSVATLPLPLLAYLFLAYTVALPLKDFKDIRGDALDHVYTLPVILGERKGKQIIGSLVFLLFAVSPVLLNIQALFLPALFFATLAFWTIQKSNGEEQSFFSYRKLPGIVLALTALYGFLIIFLVR